MYRETVNGHALHSPYLFIKSPDHVAAQFGKHAAWQEEPVSPLFYLHIRTCINRISQFR